MKGCIVDKTLPRTRPAHYRTGMSEPHEYRARIFRLSVAERLQLVEELWDSIAEDSDDLPLADEDLDELDRRWADYLENPHLARSWDEVYAELLAEL